MSKSRPRNGHAAVPPPVPVAQAEPSRPSPAPRRLSWWLVLAGVVFVTSAVGAWWALGRPTERAGGVDLGRLVAGARRDDLNLLVITLDTTRADHLGSYGSTDVATPVLDGLAREGVVFEQAMTVAPLTLPAHTSILTGRFPPEHGVRDNGGFFVSPEQETLAEWLAPRGFATGGFVAAYVLDGKWGLDQGFQTYGDDFDASRSRSLDDVQRPANEVVDKALPWLDSVKGRRFFGWLHFYDPHTPYEPPEPYRSQYPGHPYRGEIAFMDAQIGRVVGFLEERGLLDSTVIAVIGDHGESLGEHGEDAHGFFIYEGATRVPFIVRAPFEATRGRRVTDPVRAVDLVPTVCELLGVPVPTPLSGVSLVPLMSGARAELGLDGYAEAMYPLHHYGWSDLRALRSGRFKLIDAPRPELYDLELDPRERTNLFEQRRQLGDRMIAQLRENESRFERADAAKSASTDVDPEVRARLAALGYVGSFVASSSDPRTDRADPKDKVALFNRMSGAREIGARPGGSEKSLALLTSVVEEDPDVIDAWFSIGNLHFREGRFKEAIAHYRRALALKPDYDLAVINIAASYRALGDDEAAIAGFEHHLRLDPKDAYVRYQLGDIWLERGDLDKSARLFHEALEVDASVAPAKNALGVIAFRRGDLDGAEGLIREAIALKPDVRLARYNLALIAEQRGDPRTAEREYLEELKAHPDAYKAAFNLAQLYEAQGQRQLQVDALRQSIEANPRFAEGHVYLAKAMLDAGRIDEGIELARKGLDLKPRPEVAPLGHYVLADLYNRKGRSQDAAREVAKGRAEEARARAAH